jgi:hypothetical protein
MDEANAVLKEMVSDGAITAEERSRMAVRAYPRRKRDLLAPFASNGKFRDLTVEDCDMSELPDAAWTDYERDGNKEALVNKHVLFFRSIFVPSLASALNGVQAGHAEALQTFGDEMEQRLRRRLASLLAPTRSVVQTIVLAKAVPGGVGKPETFGSYHLQIGRALCSPSTVYPQSVLPRPVSLRSSFQIT